jgi:hypothetical protein
LRNVLPAGGAGAAVDGCVVWVEPVDCCPGMCWVCWPESLWLPLDDDDDDDDEDEESEAK